MKTPFNLQKRFARIGTVAILAAGVTLALPAFAQSQDNSSQSVAEAARKAKEQKKAATKENRVITEDTLNLRPASADANGAPPAGTIVTTTPGGTPADSTAAATDAAKTVAASQGAAATTTSSSPASDAKKKEEQAAEVAKTKELLAQAQAALDLLKRKLALDSESFYSNPDYAHNTGGKATLDQLKSMIGDKQISVDDLKSQLAELMQKAGISPDADKSPALPQN